MEWKPIETAPRDGREFLAYDSRVKKFDVCYMFNVCADHYAVSVVQYDSDGGPNDDDFGWCTDDITHWMPLPQPPETNE